jgi:glycosyltransferase involved in cell wall biosynthesis
VHIGFIAAESPFDLRSGGGIAAYLRAMIPGLLQAGHRVTVVAGSREKVIQHDYGDVCRIVHVRLPNFHWYLSKIHASARSAVLPLRQIEWSFALYSAARRVFDRDPVDVLESTETGAMLFARYPLAPLVIRLHGSDYVFRKYTGESVGLGNRLNHHFEVMSWRYACLLTSPSQFQRSEATIALGTASQRIDVIPNPIGPEILATALREQPSRCHDHSLPSVLYTGRLAPVKGFRPLLQAIEQVVASIPQAHFILAGPWQMVEQPEQWNLHKTDVCTGETISWLGHLPWQQLVKLYLQSGIFVQPSYYETFGIACIEAMAFGLPVVATTAGGLPEVVEDGVTGILVPAGDARALADAVICLLRDPERRCRMGRTGRERVLAEFTIERVVARTLTAYQQVVRN